MKSAIVYSKIRMVLWKQYGAQCHHEGQAGWGMSPEDQRPTSIKLSRSTIRQPRAISAGRQKTWQKTESANAATVSPHLGGQGSGPKTGKAGECLQETKVFVGQWIWQIQFLLGLSNIKLFNWCVLEQVAWQKEKADCRI